MTGVYSGTNLESVGFFANIITPLDDLAAFAFQVIYIRHAEFVDGGKILQPTPANERGLMGETQALARVSASSSLAPPGPSRASSAQA